MSRAATRARQPRHSHRAAAPALPYRMEGRAGSVVEGDDAHTALMRELNYFPTPPWAARAGGELVRSLDRRWSSGDCHSSERRSRRFR